MTDDPALIADDVLRVDRVAGILIDTFLAIQSKCKTHDPGVLCTIRSQEMARILLDKQSFREVLIDGGGNDGA